MFQSLVNALRTPRRTQKVRFSIVVDPAEEPETKCRRHRLVLGGKVIDLIRVSTASTKGATNELDVE